MTKKTLEGLTIAQIKAEYPNGTYKSGMKKAEIIAEALKSVKSEEKPQKATARAGAER